MISLFSKKGTNLDLGLDVFDGVATLDIKGDGLSSQSLDEDLHDEEIRTGLFAMETEKRSHTSSC